MGRRGGDLVLKMEMKNTYRLKAARSACYVVFGFLGPHGIVPVGRCEMCGLVFWTVGDLLRALKST